MPPARSVLLALLLVGCAPPLSPPTKTVPQSGATTTKRDLGPLVAVGWGADVVGHDNVTMKPDGAPDFTLRVRISGDVKALVLHSSDTAGNPVGGELWTTMTGPDVFPTEWHLPAREARFVWALAVFGADGKLLNPAVKLEPTTFPETTLTLCAGDTGRTRFVSGRTYTLIVQRSDGSVDRATTTIL
jgi:hypothetical protein